MGRRKSKAARRKNGSMSNMRGGFKGMFKSGGKKSSQADPQQFFKILGVLFVLGALIFFGTR